MENDPNVMKCATCKREINLATDPRSRYGWNVRHDEDGNEICTCPDCQKAGILEQEDDRR